MKRFLLSIAMMALACVCTTAQVENRALLLSADGKVECGILPEMNGIHSYTVQMWFKPTTWQAGATLIERGNMRVALGQSAGKLSVTVGGTENVVSSSAIANKQWQQLTLINSKGRVKVRINNQEAASLRVNNTAATMDAPLTLGGGFTGLIDEVRIWNKALTSEFDYFWNNTLNEFNQQRDNLIVYYKMDHEEWTESLVDYKSLWKGGKSNHHGVITGGEFVGVDRRSADKTHLNDKLPYLLNGAYTNTPRFCDAGIPRESYLLSNDIICLFIEMGQDGHLHAIAPNNHATLNGTATWKSSVSGRKGVVKFDGSDGCTMTSPGRTLNSATNYTINGWIKIDSWVVGATILRKGDFSIKLGKRSVQELIINVGDQQYIYETNLEAAGWHYLSITPAGTLFNVSIDDNAVTIKQKGNSTQLPQADAEVVWGEGLKATLDDWCIWNRVLSSDEIQKHKDGAPLPSLGGRMKQADMNGANTYYRFDNKDFAGLDSYSLDGMKAVMEAAYDGYRGYQFRVAVRASTGEFAWDQTITDKQKRQNFADDLADLVGTYAGVELDLEWVYYDGWATFGDLIDQIRDALPQGKTFMVSMHNVSWKFVPTNRISKVDGFTMQQYGPQKTHFTYSSCVNNYNNFKTRYPKEKIYLSWSSTTTCLYNDSESRMGDIAGVNWGAMGDDYVPGDDMERFDRAGGHHYFMSPVQVYRRAKFAQNEGCQGIFYWDMANDYRVGSKYCMARYSTYGLNANVDRIVTKATPSNPTATGTVADDPDQAIPEVLELKGQRIKAESSLKDGAYVAWLCGDASFDGKSWIGGGDRYDRSEESEYTPSTAVFRLDKADDGCFYIYNMSTHKYIGHATDKSSRGDFYEIVWCDDTNDSRVSRMAIKKVSASGNLYLPTTSSYMFNMEDKNATAYTSLKVGDTEANFGYLGTNSWKVWLMYSFSEQDLIDAGLVDGINTISAPTPSATIYDLQGRPVTQQRPGLYIINGRKVMIK